jgi:serine O-acetyltransferase
LNHLPGSRHIGHKLGRLLSDVDAACANDPAARSRLEVVATYPGVHAIWAHRVAHWLWNDEHKLAARFLSAASRFATGIEIHPGARIGRGVFIDHGMGVVIGETATVGDGCLIYKGVVLGGTSLEHRVRHPQVGANVVIGSNACVLGNIEIGAGARIGSGSVVVKPVPPGVTVVGVPARLVHEQNDRRGRFARTLDHANLSDPVADMIRALAAQDDQLRARLQVLESTLQLPSPNSELDFNDPFATGGEPYPKFEGG